MKNEQVFYIDNMASSLSNQNIVKALDQMGQGRLSRPVRCGITHEDSG